MDKEWVAIREGLFEKLSQVLSEKVYFPLDMETLCTSVGIEMSPTPPQPGSTRKSSNASLLAFSRWVGSTPVIWYDSRLAGSWKRMALAHELYHLLTWGERVDCLIEDRFSGEGDPLFELYADLFATELLMPLPLSVQLVRQLGYRVLEGFDATEFLMQARIQSIIQYDKQQIYLFRTYAPNHLKLRAARWFIPVSSRAGMETYRQRDDIRLFTNMIKVPDDASLHCPFILLDPGGLQGTSIPVTELVNRAVRAGKELARTGKLALDKTDFLSRDAKERLQQGERIVTRSFGNTDFYCFVFPTTEKGYFDVNEKLDVVHVVFQEYFPASRGLHGIEEIFDDSITVKFGNTDYDFSFRWWRQELLGLIETYFASADPYDLNNLAGFGGTEVSDDYLIYFRRSKSVVHRFFHGIEIKDVHGVGPHGALEKPV